MKKIGAAKDQVLTFLQSKGKTGQSFQEIQQGTGLPESRVYKALEQLDGTNPPKIIRSCHYFRSNA